MTVNQPSSSQCAPTARRQFPFTQVVGQSEAKLALMLVAIDPLIGGVLLRGEKGSAKTTLARGLASLLSDSAPFVDLPLGATEDRLIGTLDLSKALMAGEFTFTPGLLAEVDQGVLYVDEINLLADHLVDTLLDVSVSGQNRIERDGISHAHESRFVLVGSMNPEEGELRPQLLDRFGLSVSISASQDLRERTEAVRRRLAFDQEKKPGEGTGAGNESAQETALRSKLGQATPAAVPERLIEDASRLALAVGAEGLRADIVLCRAAAAFAGLEGRAEATRDDLDRVAPLVLAHRSRRNPFDPPVLPEEQIQEAIDSTRPRDAEQHHASDHTPDSDPAEPEDGERQVNHTKEESLPSRTTPMMIGADRAVDNTLNQRAAINQVPNSPSGRRQPVESAQGRFVRDVASDPAQVRPIAVAATVRQVATKKGAGGAVDESDIRHAIMEGKAGSLLILVVDTSGSMGSSERAEVATGTALGLLTDAYQRRDHVALVTFRDQGAEVALQPTGSIEVARNRLSDLQTGGQTPLQAGLRTAIGVAEQRRDQSRLPFCVVLTDGRASGESDALDSALAEAALFKKAGYRGLVLDCETGSPKLGLARRLAEAMGVDCISATDLDSTRMAGAIRLAEEQNQPSQPGAY